MGHDRLAPPREPEREGADQRAMGVESPDSWEMARAGAKSSSDSSAARTPPWMQPKQPRPPSGAVAGSAVGEGQRRDRAGGEEIGRVGDRWDSGGARLGEGSEPHAKQMEEVDALRGEVGEPAAELGTEERRAPLGEDRIRLDAPAESRAPHRDPLEVVVDDRSGGLAPRQRRLVGEHPRVVPQAPRLVRERPCVLLGARVVAGKNW